LSGQTASLLIACLGSAFVVMMGSIDLSVGAIVILTGAIGVKIMNSYGLGLSILPIAALIGGTLGLFNGIVYVRGRIQSFVVTLGSLSIFTGIDLNLLDGRAVEFTNEDFDDVAIGQVLPHVPNIALWAVGAWLVVVFVSQRTRFGRYMYLIGGGETVARTAGVPVDRFKVYAFGLSGLMAGLAAILLVARLGSAGPSSRFGSAAGHDGPIVVGGTSLAGGVGGPQRTLIGVLIIAILDNGLNLRRGAGQPRVLDPSRREIAVRPLQVHRQVWPMPKRLILTSFSINAVSHVFHGFWRRPDTRQTEFNALEAWIELAQLLERGSSLVDRQLS
jgi:ribose transport system permease protein